MPSVAVKLYSVFFKFMLKHRLQNRIIQIDNNGSFGVTSRPNEESIASPNPLFTDGVATKDLHVHPGSSISIRIFLPETCLNSPDSDLKSRVRISTQALLRRNSYGYYTTDNVIEKEKNMFNNHRRSSVGCSSNASDDHFGSKKSEIGVLYRGYSPAGGKKSSLRKLPVLLQFHGGGFVSGSNDSTANDLFCRRIAKLCDVIVLAVGYRLAPEDRYPAAFEDGLNVLHWLAKQANLAECSKSVGVEGRRGEGTELRKSGDAYGQIADAFGASLVEPWLAAHGDPSRCVLLGVSCGGNIADYVARKAVEAGKLLDPVKVVFQVLMYPFFIGSVPTHSEIKLANSYFYDKALCTLAWKLFLPEGEFDLDHPAANPLTPDRGPPLTRMPPTLTVIAEHDWMRDRAIAYSEELRKVNVDAPVLEYKDAVHEFATLDMLLKTPQAQACAEDIAIWVKKYISLRGHEFSY
ncbi:hypothetical protein K7X08_032717 [Anisodus acutangulus]|uniref:Alpha/beta hydrolase fold-3 domain-containing protein n=1 Tax=Anisodus acutangulus TaxID=402998 RepID=A0A9Q1M1D5_9SOLA|nr:hypothetical protein K7X08_032717 [Anisodus acutangulus]